MATEIKAIRCPQCGSTQKTETKPGSYCCSSCQTEYFLDDGRLTIQHHHTFHPPAAAAAAPRLTLLARFGLLLAAAVGVIAYLYLDRNRGAAPSGGMHSYYYGIEQLLPLAGSSQTPMVLVVARLNRQAAGGKAHDEASATFYDPLKHEEVKAQQLADGVPTSRFDADARTFSDGQQYVLVNFTTLYKVDREAMRLIEVGKQWFQQQPALSAGVARVEFVPTVNGDGLAVLTNDGKSRFYYPLVNRLYTEDELRAASAGFTTLLPGASLKTHFTFTDPNPTCKGALVKLLALKVEDNGGGPKNLCKDVMCSEREVGEDPVTHISKYQPDDMGSPDHYRVRTYRDLTPGRLYFEPEILYSDVGQLIITTRATPAPDALQNLQCLDPATGRVRWTTPLTKEQEIQRLVACNKGFVGVGYQAAGVVLSSEGKIISSFNLH